MSIAHVGLWTVLKFLDFSSPVATGGSGDRFPWSLFTSNLQHWHICVFRAHKTWIYLWQEAFCGFWYFRNNHWGRRWQIRIRIQQKSLELNKERCLSTRRLGYLTLEFPGSRPQPWPGMSTWMLPSCNAVGWIFDKTVDDHSNKHCCQLRKKQTAFPPLGIFLFGWLVFKNSRYFIIVTFWLTFEPLCSECWGPAEWDGVGGDRKTPIL